MVLALSTPQDAVRIQPSIVDRDADDAFVGPTVRRDFGRRFRHPHCEAREPIMKTERVEQGEQKGRHGWTLSKNARNHQSINATVFLAGQATRDETPGPSINARRQVTLESHEVASWLLRDAR